MKECKVCGKKYKNKHENYKCKFVLVSQELNKLKEQKLSVEEENLFLKKQIEITEDKGKILHIQNSIYIHIIKQYSGIDLSNHMYVNEKGVNIDCTFTDKMLNITMHSSNNSEIPYNSSSDTLPILEKEYEETITKVEETQVKEYSFSDICNIKRKKFENISNKKSVKNSIEKIKECNKIVFQLLGNMNSYKKQIFEDYNKLDNILKKIYKEEDKRKRYLSSMLSPIDYRLLEIDNFHNINLSVHDIHELTSCLTNKDENWVPFNYEDFLNSVQGYSFALNDISYVFSNNISEKFPNIVYISDNDDQYSFYTLEEIKFNKRHWKPACRLYELSCKLSNDLVSTMITTFRNTYSMIYNDNNFRQDFLKRSCIMYLESELKQMLDNILFVTHDERLFSKFFMQVIKENFKYEPTSNDVFEKFEDEYDIKAVFEEQHDDNLIRKNTIRQVFDSVNARLLTDFKYEHGDLDSYFVL